MTLAIRLKEARLRRGLTQQALANAFGITRAAVTQWELGKTIPDADKLDALAQLLRVDIAWLLGGRGHGPAAEAAFATLVGVAGAGDEIMPIAGDHSFERILAPPGMRDPVCVRVRGESMWPAFHDGDLLFYQRADGVPAGVHHRDCVCEVVDGPMYIKEILRAADGLYNLKSRNPRYDQINDVRLAWAAPVRWIHRE